MRFKRIIEDSDCTAGKIFVFYSVLDSLIIDIILCGDNT